MKVDRSSMALCNELPTIFLVLFFGTHDVQVEKFGHVEAKEQKPERAQPTLGRGRNAC